MNNSEWKEFLTLTIKVLGEGQTMAWASNSWCAFTTFSSLEHNLTYWAKGLPKQSELLDDRTIDGGTWTQSFYYKDLAHFIIPAKFYWEKINSENKFQSGYRNQNIKNLSEELAVKNISHRLTSKVLEIKLY